MSQGIKKVKAVGLISGGLDSLIAAKVLQDQGIDVIGVTFSTPFWDCSKAVRIGEKAGIPMKVLDISEEHFRVVKSPVYGYGANMNPCIDCHALMIRKAGEVMIKEGAEFVFTGEVLGQRPMSQRRDTLKAVEKLSGYEGKILRPLSARLLPATEPERLGLVDRSRLLAISGRGRKEQLRLAEHYSIKEYDTPGGGCLLTKEGYSKKLKTLLHLIPNAGVRHAELIKHGRFFVVGGRYCFLVGRHSSDNSILSALAGLSDVLFYCEGIPGPVGLLLNACNDIREDVIEESASIIASLSDADKGSSIIILLKCGNKVRKTEVTVVSRNQFNDRFIK
ncbi:MAG: tRNA 4-thiouridine(8) synthase ThiI [Thermodesulforhabdaceae bacterium]